MTSLSESDCKDSVGEFMDASFLGLVFLVLVILPRLTDKSFSLSFFAFDSKLIGLEELEQ